MQKTDLINDIVAEIFEWQMIDILSFYHKRTGKHWNHNWIICANWVKKTMRADLSKKSKRYIEKMYRELQEVGRL